MPKQSVFKKNISNEFSLYLPQLNPTVGDISGNMGLARISIRNAKNVGADLVLFSELFISAYTPEDQLLKPEFLRRCEEALMLLAEETVSGPAVIIGAPLLRNGKIYNAMVVLDNGKIEAECYKKNLPNYKEFDEYRTFSPGLKNEPVWVRGVCIGLPICEDIWSEDTLCALLSEKGAEIFLVANASPYCRDKLSLRHKLISSYAEKTGTSFVYLNQIGGQDELVFDGGSFIVNSDKTIAVQFPQFETYECLVQCQRHNKKFTIKPQLLSKPITSTEADYTACMLGLRDYAQKNKFDSVILGLSGGIDSALSASLAVDALGSDRVHCVMLSYIYTSNQSLVDAELCANLLGCHYSSLSIEKAVQSCLSELSPFFFGKDSDITEENIQSRVRGVFLMALSNKFKRLLITTGNKSEVAVGNATIYGDMNGGFNPIKDLYKTEVYKLAHWRNQAKPKTGLGPQKSVIPHSIIEKAPTAELKFGQKDQDALPPYTILDEILGYLVEKDWSVCSIVKKGFSKELVESIQSLLYVAEYKRYQSAPGVKVSERSFGKDRRYPITNSYRDICNE